MATNKEIANTIVAQMVGARRLTVMAGCKDFVAIENGVQFNVGKNAAGINKCIVRLNAQDLYDVEFGACRRVKFEMTYKVKASSEGIYCDMLKAAFESATGMYLTF